MNRPCRHRKAFFREMEDLGVPMAKRVSTTMHCQDEQDLVSATATAPASLGRAVGQYLASPSQTRSQFSHIENYDTFMNALSAHDYSYRDLTCQSACAETAASEKEMGGGRGEVALLSLAESLVAVERMYRVPRGGDETDASGERDEMPCQGRGRARQDGEDFHECVRSVAREVMAEPATEPLFSLLPAVLHHALLSTEANMVCGVARSA